MYMEGRHDHPTADKVYMWQERRVTKHLSWNRLPQIFGAAR